MGSVCMVHVYAESLLEVRSHGSAVVGKFAKLPVDQMTERLRDAFFQELSLHWMFRDLPGFARIYGYSE